MLNVCLMVLNATFNEISVLSWRSVLMVEDTRGPREIAGYEKFACIFKSEVLTEVVGDIWKEKQSCCRFTINDITMDI